MVQAMIDISEEVNHILNIVKARYKLKDKSEAITKIVIECGADILEPALRPEFIERTRIIEKQKGKKFRNVYELRKHIKYNA